MDPWVGKIVDDLFLLEAQIAEGGMGSVYRARQLDIDRPVAIKILRPELVGLGEAAERFHREAQLASRIQSPHVAHVYRTGQLADGNIYLALEYLDGRNLEEVERHEGALPPARAVHILRQAGEAVAEAHDLGIVHRDLKPENVMLVRAGTDEDFVKLLDFGIAKQLGGSGVSLTGVGLAIGTPLYISPEAASGSVIGTAADVYQLGVILYEALCGEPPFAAEVAAELFMQHVRDDPPPLLQRTGGRHVSPQLAAFVHRCLAKDPAARPGDGRAFVAELDEASVATPTAAAAVAPPVEPGEPTTTEEERPTAVPPAPQRARRRRPRNRWMWIVLALGVAVGGAFGARRVLDDMRVEDLQRRADRAWAARDLEGPGGAIALDDLILTIRPNHRGAKKLRRRMAESLIAEARAAEREGRVDDALDSLGLVERIRPDDPAIQEWTSRLEATLPPGDDSSSERRASGPTRQVTFTCSPGSPVAGQAAQLTVSLRGFRGVRLEEPQFQIRAMWRGMHVRSAKIAAQPKGRSAFVAAYAFPTKGRYQIAFSAQTRDRPVTKSLQVMVSAAAAAPAPPAPAPPSEEGAPPVGPGSEPVAPEPEPRAPEPEPVAPVPEPGPAEPSPLVPQPPG